MLHKILEIPRVFGRLLNFGVLNMLNRPKTGCFCERITRLHANSPENTEKHLWGPNRLTRHARTFETVLFLVKYEVHLFSVFRFYKAKK